MNNSRFTTAINNNNKDGGGYNNSNIILKNYFDVVYRSKSVIIKVLNLYMMCGNIETDYNY